MFCSVIARKSGSGVLSRWSCTLVALALASSFGGRGRAVAEDADGRAMGECTAHTDCVSGFFCQETTCPFEGFDLPCTKCAPCLECTTLTSIDSSCPVTCPVPENQITHVQGLFTQLDEDGCISVWMFEHDNFRRYATGVQYAAAMSYAGSGNGRCDRTGNQTRILTGHYRLTGTALDAWVPSEFMMSSYQTFSATVSLIPWGVRITWKDGVVDDLIQYRQNDAGRGAGVRGAHGVLAAAQWMGSMSMFDTVCKVFLHMFPVGDNTKRGPVGTDSNGGRLYFWKAITLECEMGDKTAPGLPGRDSERRRWNESQGTGSGQEPFFEPLFRSSHLKPEIVSQYFGKEFLLEDVVITAVSSSAASSYCKGGCDTTGHSWCWWAMQPSKNMTNTSLCVCEEHFRRGTALDEYGRIICEDINECVESSHNCPQNAECSNTNGSFTCSCKHGFEDVPPPGIGIECADADECLIDPDRCHCMAHCKNTWGSFECNCIAGFQGDGYNCSSENEIEIEMGWYTGQKIAFTFSWRMKVAPDPRDIIIVDKGLNRQIWWMFLSSVNTGCTSGMQVAVGYERVSECHLETSDYMAWGSFSIQQESAGWGTYYARLYSHSLHKIVAIHPFHVDDITMNGLAPDSGYVMKGGPQACYDWQLVNRSDTCNNFGVLQDRQYCGRIDIPVRAGYVETTIPLRCGDGRAASPDEQCDDGNVNSGDGCDSSCKIEPFAKCEYTFNPDFTYSTQFDIYTISPPDSKCVVLGCGDGIRNLLWEKCDDGNDNELDGCLSSCHEADGYTCERNKTLVKIPGTQHIDELTSQMEWDYEIKDNGEVCTPFILHLRVNGIDPPGCPICNTHGECVLFENVKHCMCSSGFYSGEFKNLLNPLEMNPVIDAKYLQSNQHVCVDLDECHYRDLLVVAARSNNKTIQSGKCPPLSVCTNTFGSFSCRCEVGMEAMNTDDGMICMDANECSSSGVASTVCEPVLKGGACLNTYGSFSCNCAQGFVGDGEILKEGCSDMNECTLNTNTCASTQNCVNTFGSFNCYCPQHSPRFFGGECYTETFAEDNNALFLNWGRGETSKALYGLARFWYLPQSDPDATGKSGVARWWFLEDQMNPGAHNGIYLVPGAAADMEAGWRSVDKENILRLPVDCAGEQNLQRVIEVEGILSVNSSKLLGTGTFTWQFDPAESVLYGKEMHMIFSQFNLIRTPNNLLEEDVLTFCRDEIINAYRQRICRVFNASNPPENPLTMVLPFTLKLITASLLPETSAWDFFWQIKPIKFSFAYALRKPAEPQSNLTGIAALSSKEWTLLKQRLRSKNAAEDDFFKSPLTLGVVNKADTQMEPPCTVNRRVLIDEFSSFLLRPNYRDYSSSAYTRSGDLHATLNGFWAGTCNPRVPASGPDCRATFSIYEGVFETRISGCSGWGVPTFATGDLIEDGVTQKLIDHVLGMDLGLYRNFKIHYAEGVPAKSVPGYVIGYGSYKWDDLDEYTPDAIIVNIRPPVASGYWYPGNMFQTRFEEQDSPCQVMRLRRVSRDDARQSSLLKTFPDPTRAVAVQKVLDNFHMFRQCSEAIHGVYTFIDSLPGCRKELEPLLNASSSILSQSPSIIDTCTSPCLPLIEKEMNKTHKICAGGWHSSASSVDSPLKARTRQSFVEMVVHIADFFFKLSVACKGNYQQRRCHEVLANIPVLVGPSCRDRYEKFDENFAVSAVQLLQFDASSNGQSCNVDCLPNFDAFLVHGHCCIATIHEAHTVWLDAVLPNDAVEFSFQRASYLDSFGARQNLVDTKKDSVVIRRPHGMCPSQTDHSLYCALNTCLLGEYWPAACCSKLACKNGGKSDYVGVCQCRCTPPFAGRLCESMRTQVVFGVRVEKASMILLNFDQLRSQLSLGLGVFGGVTNVEVAYVNVAQGGRRIPKSETLDIGIRIVAPNEKEAGRMLLLVQRSQDLDTLGALFRRLGVGEMQPGFIEAPNAVSSMGVVIECETCNSVENKTNTSKQRNGIGTKVIVIVVGAVVGALAMVLLAILCLRNRSKMIATLDDGVKSVKAKVEEVKALRRRTEEEKKQCKSLMDTQFAYAGVKAGDFGKQKEAPEAASKITINLSKSIVNVSKSGKSSKFGNRNLNISNMKDTLNRDTSRWTPRGGGSADYSPFKDSGAVFTSSKCARTEPSLSVDDDGNAQDSDRDRDGSSSGSGDHSPMATYRSSKSPVSIVASIGADDGDSRIDTLILRQQRLQGKLEEMKSSKTVTKGFERGTFLKTKTKFATSLNSAPSMWSPPDGHFDLEKGGGIQISSHPSDIQVSANPDLQRILKGGRSRGKSKTSTLRTVRPPDAIAESESEQPYIWTPRNLYSRKLLGGADVARDSGPQTNRSARSVHSASASTYSHSVVLEFSALEDRGNRVRDGADDVSMISSVQFEGSRSATPRSFASRYEQLDFSLDSAAHRAGDATPRSVMSMAPSSTTTHLKRSLLLDGPNGLMPQRQPIQYIKNVAQKRQRDLKMGY